MDYFALIDGGKYKVNNFLVNKHDIGEYVDVV